MFTGIITDVGIVADRVRNADGLELAIDTRYDDLALGESVAVDGACLTVQAQAPRADGTRFTAHIIQTSLDRTAFERYAVGRPVNLERALRVGDRLGGHIVQGHVDGIGRVLRTGRRDDAVLIDLSMPAEVEAVTIPLGSITVNGVSLTVNAIPAPGEIQISLIPFTLQHTTLYALAPGDEVHLEGDTIGKYVRGMVVSGPPRTT